MGWEREIGWSKDSALALRKANARYEELLDRAKQGVWGMPQQQSENLAKAPSETNHKRGIYHIDTIASTLQIRWPQVKQK
jgi:hypothetical protein